MPPVPDPSSTAKDLPELEVGLAALKQGDYKTAIAILEAAPLATDHPLAAKAQMGLAVAYTRTGDPIRAAAVCQALRQSSNRQVSTWATQTLASLMESYPQLADQIQSAKSITFATTAERAPSPPSVPEPEPAAAVVPEPAPARPVDDLTGFTPFDPAAPPNFTAPGDRDFLLDKATRSQQNVDESFEQTTTIQSDADVANAQNVSQPAFSRDETVFLPEEAAPGMRKPNPNAVMAERARSSPTANVFKDKTAPIAASASPASTEEQPLYQAGWKQAGRLPQSKALSQVNLTRLLLLQAGTAVTLFWMVQMLGYYVTLWCSIFLTKIPFLELRRSVFDPPVYSVLLCLGVLWVASRWLLDGLLTVGYGLEPLSLGKLATYSPETAQSLQRFCRQQRISMPALGILPTAAPIAFSYGCLPRVTRTVVSQGLLEQLSDDEIATIYASEVGHISRWDVPLMSLVAVLIQIPYTVFRLVSEWGSRQQAAVLRLLANMLAGISYGLYALGRWAALWLSRERVYYSDRVAAALTGNPNGLTRALLKIAIGTAKEVQVQKQTSYLLEGFDLLTPLGHRMATTLGSVYPHTPIESVLEWERINPYRHWLSINNSHPPTGERLNLLTVFARHWHLDSELEWAQRPLNRQQTSTSSLPTLSWRTLLLQGAPFFGLVFGFVMAYLLSGIGWLGLKASIDQLAWMYGDRSLPRGLPLIGYSIGTFIRINPLFSDLPFSSSRSTNTPDSLAALLKPTEQIPLDSHPVQLEGTLLGRTGSSNLLSQDILLRTSTGIIRLHWLSPWGPIGNLLSQTVRPTDLLHQTVTVTGWFRRGATPWIDVDTIRTLGGRVSRSGHPVWSTMIGGIVAALGLYVLLQGGPV